MMHGYWQDESWSALRAAMAREAARAALAADSDIQRRMARLSQPGDVPGVLIEGTCVDVTEGGAR